MCCPLGAGAGLQHAGYSAHPTPQGRAEAPRPPRPPCVACVPPTTFPGHGRAGGGGAGPPAHGGSGAVGAPGRAPPAGWAERQAPASACAQPAVRCRRSPPPSTPDAVPMAQRGHGARPQRPGEPCALRSIASPSPGPSARVRPLWEDHGPPRERHREPGRRAGQPLSAGPHPDGLWGKRPGPRLRWPREPGGGGSR